MIEAQAMDKGVEQKGKIFSFIAKSPLLVENFATEDLQALSGLNDLRDAMIDHGVRSYYVVFLDRDGNTGYLWRNTDTPRLRKLAETMISRGLEIQDFLAKSDPHGQDATQVAADKMLIEALLAEINKESGDPDVIS